MIQPTCTLSTLRQHTRQITRLNAPLLTLIGLGLLSATVYWFGIARRYPLAQGLRTPRISWPNFHAAALSAGGLHAVIYAILTALYVAALWIVLHHGTRRTKTFSGAVVGGWLLCCAALLMAYPGESLDIFDYLFRGRMLALYGASPLAVTPNAFADKPFYRFLTWRSWVDTYGPVWEYASGATAWLTSRIGNAGIASYVLA